MAKRIKKNKDVNPLEKLIYNYENNLYTLEFFITELYPHVNRYDDMAKKQLEDYKNKMRNTMREVFASSKSELKETGSEEQEKRTSSSVNDVLKILQEGDWSRINIKFFTQRWELLWKSSFTMMIAYLDFLLSDLLHCYYDRYPEALNEEMTLTYGELRKCTNLNEAIHIIIDRKIESILFKNFYKQMRFLKDEWNINIEEGIIKWEIIDEAYQRRNILVHNDGIVNERYMKNVRPYDGMESVKKGDKLNVDGKYYLKVYMEIIVGGIILIQSCWRKWFKDNVREADLILIDSINKGLMCNEFEVAKRLSMYSKVVKLYDEQNRNNLDILYCYAMKKLGNKGEFNKEMKKLNIEGLSLKFPIKLAILKDDRELFYRNVKKAVTKGEVNRWEFRNTAIYREFSGDNDFEKKIDEIFK